MNSDDTMKNKTENLADSAGVDLQQAKANILAALEQTLDQRAIAALRDALMHLIRVEEYLGRLGQMDSDEAGKLNRRIQAMNKRFLRTETEQSRMVEVLRQLGAEVGLLRQIMERSEYVRQVVASVEEIEVGK